jgi:hypothetical protein
MPDFEQMASRWCQLKNVLFDPHPRPLTDAHYLQPVLPTPGAPDPISPAWPIAGSQHQPTSPLVVQNFHNTPDPIVGLQYGLRSHHASFRHNSHPGYQQHRQGSSSYAPGNSAAVELEISPPPGVHTPSARSSTMPPEAGSSNTRDRRSWRDRILRNPR